MQRLLLQGELEIKPCGCATWENHAEEKYDD